MRNFQMSVVERREPFTHTFETHPFESAWASEAIFFLRVESIAESATVQAQVQISADGIRWIDEGTQLPPATAVGDTFAKVRHFGGWLRLTGTIEGGKGDANLTVQLALKE